MLGAHLSCWCSKRGQARLTLRLRSHSLAWYCRRRRHRPISPCSKVAPLHLRRTLPTNRQWWARAVCAGSARSRPSSWSVVIRRAACSAWGLCVRSRRPFLLEARRMVLKSEAVFGLARGVPHRKLPDLSPDHHAYREAVRRLSLVLSPALLAQLAQAVAERQLRSGATRDFPMI